MDNKIINKAIRENSSPYVIINPELSSESTKSEVMLLTPEMHTLPKQSIDTQALASGVLKGVAIDFGVRQTTNESIKTRSYNHITMDLNDVTLLELIGFAASALFVEYQKKPRDMSDFTFTNTFRARNINVKARNLLDAKASKNEVERMLKQGFTTQDVIKKMANEMQAQLKLAGVTMSVAQVIELMKQPLPETPSQTEAPAPATPSTK